MYVPLNEYRKVLLGTWNKVRDAFPDLRPVLEFPDRNISYSLDGRPMSYGILFEEESITATKESEDVPKIDISEKRVIAALAVDGNIKQEPALAFLLETIPIRPEFTHIFRADYAIRVLTGCSVLYHQNQPTHPYHFYRMLVAGDQTLVTALRSPLIFIYAAFILLDHASALKGMHAHGGSSGTSLSITRSKTTLTWKDDSKKSAVFRVSYVSGSDSVLISERTFPARPDAAEEFSVIIAMAQKPDAQLGIWSISDDHAILAVTVSRKRRVTEITKKGDAYAAALVGDDILSDHLAGLTLGR